MESKRFTKNDSGFICENCGKEVKPLGYSSRNHCPFCLYSKHVDVLPGDRACECGGLMRPLRADPDAKRGYVISYLCEKCGAKGKNAATKRECGQPDNLALLISLTAGEYKL